MYGQAFLVSRRFEISKSLNRKDHSFFGAIAYSMKKNRRTAMLSKRLFKMVYKTDTHSFTGVDLNSKNLKRICHILKINLSIYTTMESSGRKKKMIFSCFSTHFSHCVALFYYNNYFSFISNIEKFLGIFKCDHCEKFFLNSKTLFSHKRKVHEQILTTQIQRSRIGKYKYPRNLKETLFNAGIPKEYLNNVSFDYFATYDIESVLKDVSSNNEVVMGGSTLITAQHVPMAIGVASNFTENPKLFICKTEGFGVVSVIEKFVLYLKILAHKAKRLYFAKNKKLLNYLSEKISAYRRKKQFKQMLWFKKLLIRTISHGKVLPVLGYNSARYDMPLLHYYGFFSILMQLDDLKKIIKKNGFSMVRSKHLRFLDVIRYLSPGYNLRRFITSFAPNVELGKSFFPYEYVSNLEKLRTNRLPSYRHFYSSLKKINVLEEEEIKFKNLVKSGYTVGEALKSLDIKERPKTGQENYIFLQKMWCQKKMQTLKDFLKFYLSQDLLPFMEAVKNMLDFYKYHQIEPFLDHSTLPSVTLPMLFRSIPPSIEKPFFFLDRDNHNAVRRAVLGGLVIIGTRWVDCTTSKIKVEKYGTEALPVKKVVGFDFNSLYGGTCGSVQHYGGMYCIRKKINAYKPEWAFENKVRNLGAATWLKYCEEIDNTWIQSCYNLGEKCIFVKNKKYFLDGFSQTKNIIYEFMGCFYHSHPPNLCGLCVNDPKEKHPLKKTLTHHENYLETMHRASKLRKHCSRLRIMWECEWKGFCSRNPMIIDSLHKKILPSFEATAKICTETDVLHAIKENKLFGIVFCDVNVPNYLRDKHSEFPPIYIRKTNFKLEDLHEPMKSYAMSNDLKPPSSFLTTTMKGSDLILPTEFVQFYLKQGFNVTNVKKIIQYEPNYRPFEKFLNDRIDERRSSTKNGGSVLNNMAKLLQNAAIGYTLLREEKLGNSKIIEEKHLSKIVRLKQILDIDYLGPTVLGSQYLQQKGLPVKHMYYACTQREQFIPSLPVTIGFKVLSMAKLRMLQFFHCVRTYLKDNSFEFLYSDTDSAYFAISEDNFHDCVIPRYKKKWDDMIKNKFFVTNIGINDQFTPLLLKLEAEGTKFCSLSPKMYVLCNNEGSTIKIASKGVPYNNNESLINFKQFTEALFQKTGPKKALVSSIRNVTSNDGVFTVESSRRVLSSLYCKRRVSKDLVHTYPIDYVPSYVKQF